MEERLTPIVTEERRKITVCPTSKSEDEHVYGLLVLVL